MILYILNKFPTYFGKHEIRSHIPGLYVDAIAKLEQALKTEPSEPKLVHKIQSRLCLSNKQVRAG